MYNIPKKYQKRYTREEYLNVDEESVKDKRDNDNPKGYRNKAVREFSSIKIIKNNWGNNLILFIAYIVLPLVCIKVGWEMGDGFFTTIISLIIAVFIYLLVLVIGGILYDAFGIRDMFTLYINEGKIDKSFFNRDVVLLDTNIFMQKENDALFSYFLKHKIKITILGSVFDELTKLKRNKDNSDKYKAASMGLGRLSQLQDNGLAIIGDIDIQVRNNTYADPDIINYAKDHNNKSILIISNDLDVKIRADKFINSDKSNAVLGKDIIKLI